VRALRACCVWCPFHVFHELNQVCGPSPHFSAFGLCLCHTDFEFKERERGEDLDGGWLLVVGFENRRGILGFAFFRKGLWAANWGGSIWLRIGAGMQGVTSVFLGLWVTFCGRRAIS
jgi:hypothetical protein